MSYYSFARIGADYKHRQAIDYGSFQRPLNRERNGRKKRSLTSSTPVRQSSSMKLAHPSLSYGTDLIILYSLLEIILIFGGG